MTPETLDALIRGHLAGTLTPAEAAELQAHLGATPADAARLLDATDEELLLRAAFRSPAARVPTSRGRRVVPRPVKAPAWGVAIAVAGLVVGLIAFAARMGGDRATDDLVRATNARRSLAEKQAREQIARVELERQSVEERLEKLRHEEVQRASAPPVELAKVREEREQVEAQLEQAKVEEREAREDLETASRPAGSMTLVATMTVDAAEGDVYVVRESAREKLRAGQPLQAGLSLEVAGARGRLVVGYPDGSRFEISGPGAVKDLREDAAGKHVYIVRGRVTAEVVPQARPMVFQTPQAEARVLGTLLSLSVDPKGSTRLEVRQGKVRFAKPSGAKAVDVSGGEYSLAAEGRELGVAKLETLWRLLDGHEDALVWTSGGNDPMSLSLSGEQAASGRRSLKFSYAWRDPARGGKGWCIASHPLKIGPAESWLSFRVYVQSCDETVKLGAMTWLDDEGAWHMGDVRLDKCPKQSWFTFAVPLRAGAKKNNPKGGTLYDPERVAGCGLSLVGGSATVYIDDVMLSPDAPPAARGPKR